MLVRGLLIREGGERWDGWPGTEGFGAVLSVAYGPKRIE